MMNLIAGAGENPAMEFHHSSFCPLVKLSFTGGIMRSPAGSAFHPVVADSLE